MVEAHAPADGPNEWLVDEMFEQFQADPGSVSPAWQEFFADYRRDARGAHARGRARPEPGGGARPSGAGGSRSRGVVSRGIVARHRLPLGW